MIATRFEPFGTTIFSEITARATATGSINLGQGAPDFDGPAFIKDAAVRAIRQQPNQYSPMPGLPQLREALGDRWQLDTGNAIDPATDITVTSGCTEAIPACTLGLLNPGDEAIVFEPYYDAYPAAIAMAGATPVFVPLRSQPDGSFAFDPAELAGAVSARTRAVILNTPHNPSGKVFSRTELEIIAALCRKYDLLCISDEVYDRLVYDGQHTRIATLDGMQPRTLTLGSFGKSFSLTGWKIGWAIGPADLTAGVRAAHQFLTFAVATPLQHAAAEALRVGDDYYEDLIATFRTRRDKLGTALRELGFTFENPGGGYFILADHTAVSVPLGIDNDVDLCHHLIDRAGVATIPPTAFYNHPEHGRHLLRFAFCKTDGVLDEAIARLRAWKAKTP